MIKAYTPGNLKQEEQLKSKAKTETVEDSNFKAVSVTGVHVRMWFPSPSLHFNTQKVMGHTSKCGQLSNFKALTKMMKMSIIFTHAIPALKKRLLSC